MIIKKYNKCESCALFINRECSLHFELIRDSAVAGGKPETYDTYSKYCKLDAIKIDGVIYKPEKIIRTINK